MCFVCCCCPSTSGASLLTGRHKPLEPIALPVALDRCPIVSHFSLVAALDDTLMTTTATLGEETAEMLTTLQPSSPTALTPQSQQLQQQLLTQDILVCGVCQREFALADILKFISHKVNSCSNKENCKISAFNNNASDDDFDGNDEEIPVINSSKSNLINENHSAQEDNGDAFDDDESNLDGQHASAPDASPVINVRKQTPSIISSSQRHKLIHLRHHHHRNSHNQAHHARHNQHPHNQRNSRQNVLSSFSRQSNCSSPLLLAPGEKRTADAHTNTINTGN